jgi:hypothetical protein
MTEPKPLEELLDAYYHSHSSERVAVRQAVLDRFALQQAHIDTMMETSGRLRDKIEALEAEVTYMAELERDSLVEKIEALTEENRKLRAALKDGATAPR